MLENIDSLENLCLIGLLTLQMEAKIKESCFCSFMHNAGGVVCVLEAMLSCCDAAHSYDEQHLTDKPNRQSGWISRYSLRGQVLLRLTDGLTEAEA